MRIRMQSKGRFTLCTMRKKMRRIADERNFHTEREMIDHFLLIHACTLGGTDRRQLFHTAIDRAWCE